MNKPFSNKNSHRKGGFFYGYTQCTIFELLKAHRSKVIAIKEQLHFVRERLVI